ncbi:MAG TPA: hypothetical protein VLA12_23940, partial [Planctomycetaceae bacterium]|nr:hypothetical protein [Planctomycetaceae bacterium]
MWFLEDHKFTSSQVRKNPRDLIDFGRIWTTSGNISDFGLFHIRMLRGGRWILTQRREAAKTRKGIARWIFCFGISLDIRISAFVIPSAFGFRLSALRVFSFSTFSEFVAQQEAAGDERTRAEP